MQSLDINNERKAQITDELAAAMQANDEAALAKAFTDLSSFMQEQISAEARVLGTATAQDSTILASRGYRQLTAAETKFYNNLY